MVEADADTAPAAHLIEVEVIFALPERAWRVPLRLPAGSTALEAFEASGLRARIPELGQGEPELGVFAHPCTPGRVLQDGDRVEIYRPLLIDPKDARRLRAAESGDALGRPKRGR